MESRDAVQRNQRQIRAERQQKLISFGLIAVGVLIILFVVSFSFSSTKQTSPKVEPPQVGSQLSNFTLTNIAGQSVQLNDYKGQVILLNAWATWCPPCRAEMPALNDYYLQHADQGFVVLAINAGDPERDVAAFAQDYQLAFPVLLDPHTRLLDSYYIDDYPTTILIGRNGVVEEIHIGKLTGDQIAAKVDPLLRQ